MGIFNNNFGIPILLVGKFCRHRNQHDDQHGRHGNKGSGIDHGICVEAQDSKQNRDVEFIPSEQDAEVADKIEKQICRNADQPYGPEDFVLVADGFVVSDNVSVEASSAVDTGFRWSDHNPVYLDFILEGVG